ncbi:3-oxoacyl-ACP reductase FabG [bacterium]|nr:3-oxoacyl-ACP reductase FabG [bacterium]
MKLKDKIAVITGGGRGIGSATALKFAKEGASVTVADVDPEAANKVANDIIKNGGKAIGVGVDVSSKESVDAMIQKTIEKFGSVDILVNNAGITRDSFASKMKEENWDKVINVNLKGSFLCCQAVIPMLTEKKSGKIINTSSIGVLGNPGQVNYAASKAGIIGMTRTLAVELAKFNINVNAVAPGATDTPMFDGVPDKVKDFIKSRIPLGRFALPDEIASMHLFLASDESNFITGQVIFVDGGMSIGI